MLCADRNLVTHQNARSAARFCELREHKLLGWFGRKPLSESINKLVELFLSQ